MNRVTPRGVSIEFHPFAVLWLADSVDIPITPSPSTPVVLAGSCAKVFSNDVHVVISYFVGNDLHSSCDGFNGNDLDSGCTWALRGRFPIVKMECISGWLSGVDANPA